MEDCNGFLILEKKDWENMTPDQQSWIIYNTLGDLNKRVKNLESRAVTDKCLAFLGGVIGGFVAALGLKFLGR